MLTLFVRDCTAYGTVTDPAISPFCIRTSSINRTRKNKKTLRNSQSLFFFLLIFLIFNKFKQFHVFLMWKQFRSIFNFRSAPSSGTLLTLLFGTRKQCHTQTSNFNFPIFFVIRVSWFNFFSSRSTSESIIIYDPRSLLFPSGMRTQCEMFTHPSSNLSKLWNCQVKLLISIYSGSLSNDLTTMPQP